MSELNKETNNINQIIYITSFFLKNWSLINIINCSNYIYIYLYDVINYVNYILVYSICH
jgi:hypothetical protein